MVLSQAVLDLSNGQLIACIEYSNPSHFLIGVAGFFQEVVRAVRGLEVIDAVQFTNQGVLSTRLAALAFQGGCLRFSFDKYEVGVSGHQSLLGGDGASFQHRRLSGGLGRVGGGCQDC
jgi:hypothetical protein